MGRQRAKLARAMTDIETSRMICHCVLYPVLTYIEKKREGGGKISAAIFRPSIRHAGKIKPHREENTVTKGAAHSENGGTGSRRSGPGDPRRFGAKARPLRKGRGQARAAGLWGRLRKGPARPGSFNMGVNGGRRALPLGPCPLGRPPIRGGARPGSFDLRANGGRIAYFDDDYSSGVMEKHRLSISLPSYMR